MTGKGELLEWRPKKDKNGALVWKRFPRIDSSELLAKLRPDNKGRAFAQEFPDTSQDPPEGELTSIEQVLLSQVNEHITGLKDWHQQVLGQIKAEMAPLEETATNLSNINYAKIRIQQGFEGKVTDIKELFKERKSSALRDHLLKENSLRAFKSANNISENRDAKPRGTLNDLAWLYICLILEALANMFFFPSDLGLLGGFGMAFGVSATNVVACFALGYFALPRVLNLNTRTTSGDPNGRLPGKIAAIAGLIVTLIVIFGLHTTVAHYREVSALDGDIHGLSIITFDPRGLQDLQSLALVLIGWSVSVFAMYKGYKYDDPYPGYGEVYRAWKDEDNRMLTLQREYRASINTAYGIAAGDVMSIPNQLAAGKRSVQTLKAEVTTYLACVESYYEQAWDAGKQVLAKFRSEVQGVRNNANSLPITASLARNSIRQLDPEELKIQIIAELDRTMEALSRAEQVFDEHHEALLRPLEEVRKEAFEFTVKQVGSGVLQGQES